MERHGKFSQAAPGRAQPAPGAGDDLGRQIVGRRFDLRQQVFDGAGRVAERQVHLGQPRPNAGGQARLKLGMLGDNFARLLVIGEAFGQGIPGAGSLPGAHQVTQRFFAQAAAAEMVGEQLDVLGLGLGVKRLERLAGALVQDAQLGGEQRGINGFAGEGMAEAIQQRVIRIGGQQPAALDQLTQAARNGGAGDDVAEHCVIEVLTEHGGGLHHVQGLAGEQVQPAQQKILKGGGHAAVVAAAFGPARAAGQRSAIAGEAGQGVVGRGDGLAAGGGQGFIQAHVGQASHGGGQVPGAAGLPQPAALHQEAQRFLQRERVPAKRREQPPEGLRRARGMEQRANQLVRLGFAERAEADRQIAVLGQALGLADQRPVRAGHLSARDEHQRQRGLAREREQEINQIERAQVEPVDVLKDQQHRALRGGLKQQGAHTREDLLAQAGGRQVAQELVVAFIGWPQAQQALKLLALRGQAVGQVGALEHIHQRPIAHAGPEGFAFPDQAGDIRPGVGDNLVEQAGLAHAGLGLQVAHPAQAVGDQLVNPIHQRAHLALAADQLWTGAGEGLRQAGVGADAPDGKDRPEHAGLGRRVQRGQLVQAAHGLGDLARNSDLVGAGRGGQGSGITAGERGAGEDRGLARIRAAAGPAPGGQAQAEDDLKAMLPPAGAVEARTAIHRVERGLHGLLGQAIGELGRGPAEEIGQAGAGGGHQRPALAANFFQRRREAAKQAGQLFLALVGFAGQVGQLQPQMGDSHGLLNRAAGAQADVQAGQQIFGARDIDLGMQLAESFQRGANGGGQGGAIGEAAGGAGRAGRGAGGAGQPDLGRFNLAAGDFIAAADLLEQLLRLLVGLQRAVPIMLGAAQRGAHADHFGASLQRAAGLGQHFGLAQSLASLVQVGAVGIQQPGFGQRGQRMRAQVVVLHLRGGLQALLEVRDGPGGHAQAQPDQAAVEVAHGQGGQLLLAAQRGQRLVQAVQGFFKAARVEQELAQRVPTGAQAVVIADLLLDEDGLAQIGLGLRPLAQLVIERTQVGLGGGQAPDVAQLLADGQRPQRAGDRLGQLPGRIMAAAQQVMGLAGHLEIILLQRQAQRVFGAGAGLGQLALAQHDRAQGVLNQGGCHAAPMVGRGGGRRRTAGAAQMSGGGFKGSARLGVQALARLGLAQLIEHVGQAVAGVRRAERQAVGALQGFASGGGLIGAGEQLGEAQGHIDRLILAGAVKLQQGFDTGVVGDGFFVGVALGGAAGGLHQIANGQARLALLQVVADAGRGIHRQVL